MSALSRFLRMPAATLILLWLVAVTAWAAPVKVQMQITGYVINADLDPAANRLTATADVTFTALEELNNPTFELNNGLLVTKATDPQGKPLQYERLTNNNTVRFTPAVPLAKGTTTTYHFEYSGALKGADTSPVEGIKLASVEDPISILLYPGRWFPMTGLFTNRITARNEQRLLSNTLAHQWWGSQISPATMNDAWITNGMSRYAELMYLEDSAGKNAFQSAITDISAGALAYDTEPLTTIGRLDPFSPQFQSMTLEKGAMVFHMLRWEMGNDVFQKFLRDLLSQYTDKPIRTSNVETVAEAQAQTQ